MREEGQEEDKRKRRRERGWGTDRKGGQGEGGRLGRRGATVAEWGRRGEEEREERALSSGRPVAHRRFMIPAAEESDSTTPWLFQKYTPANKAIMDRVCMPMGESVVYKRDREGEGTLKTEIESKSSKRPVLWLDDVFQMIASATDAEDGEDAGDDEGPEDHDNDDDGAEVKAGSSSM